MLDKYLGTQFFRDILLFLSYFYGKISQAVVHVSGDGVFIYMVIPAEYGCDGKFSLLGRHKLIVEVREFDILYLIRELR